MAGLEVREYATYNKFAEEWEASEADSRMLWQLLGKLDADELLIEIPDWLADKKIGFVDGSTPTLFIGHIERETEKAVRLADSAAARPLMKLAHRIHNLEQNEADPDREEWLDRRLAEHRTEFDKRKVAVALSDEWLPKSQILHTMRRQESS